MQKFWAKLNLSQKIVFPFLVACLSVLMLGLFTVGHWFASNLEQNLREEVKFFAERVYQDFQYEQKKLENQINLIADREDIRLAVENQDRGVLLKTLLPLRTILSLDWIKVVDTKGNVLLDTRASQLGQANLLDVAIASSAIGGAGFSDLVDVEGGRQTLQTVIHPIKSKAGLLGGMMIAQLVDDRLLQKFAAGSFKHLISMRNGQILATTLPSVGNLKWLTLADAADAQLLIDDQRYLARSISFEGASQSLSTTVLSPIAQLDTAKNWLWFRFGIVFLFEAIIVAIVGFLIAQAITRPLKLVSQVAKKVVRDSNFNLQAPVISQDEVGVVAGSLNQLIQQVRQLLREQQEDKEQLEIYNQTLEQQVESRTEELNHKNVELQTNIQMLKETQSQLIQSEKMSALGQLVAGIAHEINNPINFIHGNLKYANEYIQDLLKIIRLCQKYDYQSVPEIQAAIEETDLDFLSQDLPKILTSMTSGTERICAIVLSLRNFSRLDEADFKTVNLHEGIDSTLLILQHRLKGNNHRPNTKVAKDYGEIPQVKCLAGQLNQVFMNVLANAIDAVEDAYEQGICPDPTIYINSKHVGNSVVIRISDNGTGIPEAVQKNLFNPFFTTKEVGKGTGLGLSISYQIVTEKHGGSLECISSLGEGAEFIITIPVEISK